MIGYINGLVIDKDEKYLLVLTQSIGYTVFVNTELLAKTQVEQKIQLFIHTAVREDDISLYGFKEREELTFFRQLIGVSGIGPKVALDILSTPINLTQSAIVNGDTSILTKIKGLGKKTAERVILELKNKIIPMSSTEGGVVTPSIYNEDAVMALENLGYEKFQIIKILQNIPKEISETEEVVKYFLKNN